MSQLQLVLAPAAAVPPSIASPYGRHIHNRACGRLAHDELRLRLSLCVHAVGSRHSALGADLLRHEAQQASERAPNAAELS